MFSFFCLIHFQVNKVILFQVSIQKDLNGIKGEISIEKCKLALIILSCFTIVYFCISICYSIEQIQQNALAKLLQNNKQKKGFKFSYNLMKVQPKHQIESLSIGPNEFRRTFFNAILPFLSREAQSRIQHNIWCFKFNKEWLSVLREIQKTSCLSLITWGFLREGFLTHEIINCISHIQFTALKTLYLRNNHIESLQGIAYLNMERLGTLDLSENPITSLKPLNKTKWAELLYITTLNDQLQLHQFGHLLASKLKAWYFSANKHQTMQLHDPSSLAKLQSSKISIIQFSSSFFHQKIGSVLKKRFGQSSILIQLN